MEMDRSEVLKAFEPLRRRFKGWAPPMLTIAEQAKMEKSKSTVEQVVSHSVEGFLEEGSKLRLELNTSVNDIVERLHGETGTLEDAQLAAKMLQSQLDEARSVRIAADAFELLKQETLSRRQAVIDDLNTDHQGRVDAIEAERLLWTQQDEEDEAAHSEQKVLLNDQRARGVVVYEYELNRRRTLASDKCSERREILLRSLRDQDTAREAEFKTRLQVVEKLEAEAQVLTAENAQLTERLETEPNATRASAISKIAKEAKEEAEITALTHQSELDTRDRLIESKREFIERQKTMIEDLEIQIKEATAHNQRLSMQAMTSPADKKEVA